VFAETPPEGEPREDTAAAEQPDPTPPPAAAESAPQADPPVAEEPEAPSAEEPEAPSAEEPEAPSAEQPAAEAEQPAAEAPATPAAEPGPQGPAAEAPAPERPAVPGADLEVDIVPEGMDPLARGEQPPAYAEEASSDTPDQPEDSDDAVPGPIAAAAIDLAAGARYKATGKRKTAIARVILRPGSGTYTINGKPLDVHFPRPTLQRNIRQPLETVGYEARMDVVANLHGGGISSQAGALRHGISRALLEADPNLRGELKRRGFLTRDSRVKERKKAGLKKARKRPQFSKR
jgi:small subunit ribosomal protein S9